MPRIRGGRWLDVVATDVGHVIQESPCLRYLVDELPNSAEQQPQLWAFLGSARKNEFLQRIFTQNTFTRADTGTVRLRGDVASIATNSPIFFADGDPWNASLVSDSSLAKEGSNYNVDWNAETASDIIHGLYSRVLFIFADIVCVFLDDIPNGADFAGLFAKNNAGSLPLSARPHLLVVDKPGSERSHSAVNSAQLSEAFSAVSVLTPVQSAHDSAYDSLKSMLETHSQQMRKPRQCVFGQLSGGQLTTFLGSAISHLARTREHTYDFVMASRALDERPTDMGCNLNEAYRKCVDVGLHERESARFVASALIMDHYRPGVPCKYAFPLCFCMHYQSHLVTSSDGSNPRVPDRIPPNDHSHGFPANRLDRSRDGQ